jgi:putative superfamily III holin-X
MTTGFSRDADVPAAAGASVAPGAPGDESVGQLLGEVLAGVSKLFRQEVALAKAELKEEAGKAGRAGGMLAGAGFAGYMVAVLLSLALVFALGSVMPLGWAAVIVAVLWGIVGAVLYTTGRRRLKQVDPVPRQTVETLKEDAQWARNPTT